MNPSKHVLLIAMLVLFSSRFGAMAQVCDPGVAPTGLISTYAPGSGALLQWDAVSGSVGVQVKATSPAGTTLTRRILGFERDQFLIPEALLSPGVYSWQVQAACSTTPPYSVTPISTPNTFVVGVAGCPASVTDIDGNLYPTVEINGQCWMQQNLAVKRYRNGDALPTGLSNSAWTSTSIGAYAVYNDDGSNEALFGLLYNWFAVEDSRGLCPVGWHVPTDSEYVEFTLFLGGSSAAGGAMKSVGTLLLGTGLWEEPNVGATNSSGFSGEPGGFRSFFGDYVEKGVEAYWWTGTPSSASAAWNRRLITYTGNASRFMANKQNGFSLRCLQD